MLVRASLVVLCLVAAAWFGLGIRQAHDTARATAVISKGDPVTPAQARRVSSWLDAAGWLNPDRQVAILRGELAALVGQPRRAEQIFEQVTRAEPENLLAWLALAQAALHENGPLLGSAAARIASLDPKLK